MAPANERMKKSREKKKKDPDKWEAHLEKERQRDKKRRLKKKAALLTNQKEAVRNRDKIRERVRACRARKKLVTLNSINTNAQQHSPIGTYKCVQTFGKAVNKVKRLLPESPHKKRAVLKKIVADVIGPEIGKLLNVLPKKPCVSLSEDQKNCVVDFFCQDDISRQAPGIKDYSTIKDKDGTKQKIQKRHLVMTVGEAYQEFKKGFPDLKVGKSKFYSLRPSHVLLHSATPHNVCVCKYHFNVIDLTQSIAKVIPGFPKTHKDLLRTVSCDMPNEKCMYGQCSKCGQIDLKDIFSDNDHEDLKKEISWKQWEEDDSGHPSLKKHVGTCEAALTKLEQKLGHFKKHCYVKKTQSDYVKKLKQDLSVGKAILQFDFAENYSVVTQDEIQTAHWSHSQITIFTCCLWLPNQPVQSFAIISDDKSHSKFSVWTFLKNIITNIKITNDIDYLCLFSDNCAGQFKSKFTLSNLCWFETDFGLNAEWNFFSSSHGKGAMDGVGGVVKRTVWTAVKARKVLISDARDFYEYASKNLKSINCMFVGKEEVEGNIQMLEKRWENVKAIPDIQQCHHFQPYDKTDLLISKTSISLMLRVTVFKTDQDQPTNLHTKRRLVYSEVYSSTESSESDCEQTVEDNPQVPTYKITRSDVKSGVFVLVEVCCVRPAGNKKPKLQKKFTYVGVCQDEVDDEGDVKIMFLKSTSQDGKTFKDSGEDISFVKFEQITCKLPVPDLKPQGNRLYYQFSGSVSVFEKNF